MNIDFCNYLFYCNNFGTFSAFCVVKNAPSLALLIKVKDDVVEKMLTL